MTADWSWLRTFLAAAEHGSLSAAARALQISQPTASRHIQALEEETGASLFVRHSRGLSLTDEGAALLEDARGIDVQMRAILRRTSGSDETPRGVVRLSVNEPLGIFVLAPWYGEVCRSYPEVGLEVVIDNRAANLTTREADLAVRMFRPTQLDLVARKIGDLPLGLFASEAYLAQHGTPVRTSDLAGHTFVGFDMDPDWLAVISKVGLHPEQFHLRSNSIALQAEAVRVGAAIGAMHVAMAQRLGLTRVLAEIPLPPLELWVVIHESLRDRPALRAVMRSLEAYLIAYASEERAPKGR